MKLSRRRVHEFIDSCAGKIARMPAKSSSAVNEKIPRRPSTSCAQWSREQTTTPLDRCSSNIVSAISSSWWLLQDAQVPLRIAKKPLPRRGAAADFNRIRCPLCKWQPKPSHRWFCAPCDYPEFFADGCGACWNTFSTGGRCPGCGHQWHWTACLRCAGWSPHADWYENQAKKQ